MTVPRQPSRPRALRFDNIAAFEVGGTLLGSFLAELLSFVVVATLLFFLIRAAARFRPQPPEDSPPAVRPVMRLREIRDALLAAPGDRSN